MTILSFDPKLYKYYTRNLTEILNANNLQIKYSPPKELTFDDSVEILLGGHVTKENIELLPNLKLVIVPYTGLDNLDLDTLKQKSIKVLNTSAHGIFVAERAFSLALALSGRLIEFHNNLTDGNWSQRYTNDFMSWSSLHNKKVAVYGFGHIGQEVARLFSVFNCEIGILSYKNRTFDKTTNFDSLEELSSWCDYLVVCTPLTEITKNSINEKILSKMEHKFIINVGRGNIIDEADLYNHLNNNFLGGFASDVWYEYPDKKNPDRFPSTYDFHKLNNVVMTPHNAGFEVTAYQVRYKDVLNQIINFVDQN